MNLKKLILGTTVLGLYSGCIKTQRGVYENYPVEYIKGTGFNEGSATLRYILKKKMADILNL